MPLNIGQPLATVKMILAFVSLREGNLGASIAGKRKKSSNERLGANR